MKTITMTIGRKEIIIEGLADSDMLDIARAITAPVLIDDFTLEVIEFDETQIQAILDTIEMNYDIIHKDNKQIGKELEISFVCEV